MPKRKQIPDTENAFIGLPSDANVLDAQKANNLVSLYRTPMTLAELKILDVYLGKIDSRNDQKRLVRFEKGEIENLLDVTRIRKEDLTKRLDNLFQVVTISDKEKPNGFTKIALFEKAEAHQDEQTKQWTIELCCTPSAMEYFFCLENRGYYHYRIKNVIPLKSRYSIALFNYLECHRAMGADWDVGLECLKKILNCDDESYDKYKVFNDRVLKLCYSELNQKTECHFEYEPIRTGRCVTAIRFTLSQLSPKLDTMQTSQYKDTEADPFCSAVKNEFNPEQMEQIKAILDLIDTDKKIELLVERYNAMCEYSKRNEVKDGFKYLLKMLRNEYKCEDKPTSATSAKKYSFTNINAREYTESDYAAMLDNDEIFGNG